MGESRLSKQTTGFNGGGFFRVLKRGSTLERSGDLPDSGLGLITGDFAVSGCLGHEGRGAGKTDPPGGHRLVSGKKIVTVKEKLQKCMLFRSLISCALGPFFQLSTNFRVICTQT